MTDLLDPDTSWWAKLNHAESHLARLRQVCEDYRAQRPFYVEAEPTARPDEVQYRLHYKIKIPKVVPLILGDPPAQPSFRPRQPGARADRA